MIQRIQSIFLIIVAIVLLTAIGFPVWKLTTEQQEIIMTPLLTRTISGETVTETYTNAPLALILIFGAGLAIFSLLKFLNRPLQMKLGMAISLLLSLFLGLTIYFSSDLENNFGKGTFGIGFFMTAVAVVFNILSNRFIKKDEDMVREADRLR
jgi:CDP-diglyceride synthetase